MSQGQPMEVDPQDVIQALSYRLANLEIEIAARDAMISKLMEEKKEADGQPGPAKAARSG